MKKLIIFLILITSVFAQETRVNQLRAEKIITKNINAPIIYMGNLKALYKDADTIKTSANFQFLGDAGFNGNFIVGGFLNSEKTFTYAYLPENDTTIIVKADSAHIVEGAFINSPQFGFEIANGRLVYTGVMTQYFDIDLCATLASNSASTTFHLLFLNDDSLYQDQSSGGFLKFAGEVGTVTTFLTLKLAQYDSISIMTSADKTCELDFKHVNTRITRTNF